MDFSFTDEQQAVAELAERIFAGQATAARVREIEGSDDRVDWALWSDLARANLLGLAVPTDDGGSGLGIMELCLLLEQQGRAVAPLPLLATLVMAALPIGEFGSPLQRSAWLPKVATGEVVLTAALAEPGANDPRSSSVSATADGDRWRLDGIKVGVPYAHVASRVLVPARTAPGRLGLFLVDPGAPGVTVERAEVTNRELHSHLHLDGVSVGTEGVLGDPLGGGDIVGWIVDRTLVGLCAIQVGVAEEAIRKAADYTSQRTQFGKPLSTFQGVALKAADAYIDTEAMRATLWQAAWRLAEGVDASMDIHVAKWWAAEGGQRVVHITQHLHGGVGADVEYPIHRYFLWGKQIEVMLGGASQQLSQLGEAIARASRAGGAAEVGA